MTPKSTPKPTPVPTPVPTTTPYTITNGSCPFAIPYGDVNLSNMIPPLDGDYRFRGKYGILKKPRHKTPHSGIDLNFKMGAPIYSCTDGKVVKSGYDKDSAGNYVRIEDSLGYTFRYCHMKNKPTLSVGDTVNAGDIIGYVGSTGNSVGPHHHLGIGGPEDPDATFEPYQHVIDAYLRQGYDVTNIKKWGGCPTVRVTRPGLQD